MKFTKFWLWLLILISPVFVFVLLWQRDWWEAAAWVCMGATATLCKPVFTNREEWRQISEQWRANAEHWKAIAELNKINSEEWQAIAESAMTQYH